MSEIAADSGVVPIAEFIDDVGAFIKGKDVDKVISDMQEKYKALKLLENQMMQRKARLLTKQPEIQKALDMVVRLIEAQGTELALDFELAPNVYAKAKVADVTTVNLWLGAGVMVEYPLEEAKELLQTNLGHCKANIETTQADISLIQESSTTTEVSIARIYNYDVVRRRELKEADATAV